MTPTSRTSASTENRSPREIEQEIHRTRGEMDETIDRLGERLTPGKLLDNVMSAFRGDSDSNSDQGITDSLKSAGDSVKSAVQENPAPALLCAAGALWWLFEGVRSSPDDQGDLDQNALGWESYAEEEDEEELHPAWDEQYDWTKQNRETAQDWKSRAERTLSELRTSANDESAKPADSVRGAASKIVALSGYKRNEIQSRYDRLRPRGTRGRETHVGRMASWDRVASDYESADDESLQDKAANAWNSIKETLNDATQSTQSKLSAMSQAISEYAAQTGEKTSEWKQNATRWKDDTVAGASRLARRAQRKSGRAMQYGRNNVDAARESLVEGAQVAKERIATTANDYPLAVAGACFGIGLAAGLLVPETQYEDEWMGEASDELTDAAKEMAQETVDRGTKVAADTASAAIDEAERQGLTPQQVGETAREVAASVTQAAKKTAERTTEKAQDVADAAAEVGKKAADTANHEVKKQAKRSG